MYRATFLKMKNLINLELQIKIPFCKGISTFTYLVWSRNKDVKSGYHKQTLGFQNVVLLQIIKNIMSSACMQWRSAQLNEKRNEDTC